MQVNFKIHEAIKEIIPFNSEDDNLLFIIDSGKFYEFYDEERLIELFKTINIKKKAVFLPDLTCFKLPDEATNQIMEIIEKYKGDTFTFKD